MADPQAAPPDPIPPQDAEARQVHEAEAREQQPQGLDIARLGQLTDGIFAIVMTLLVLELNLPEGLESLVLDQDLVSVLLPQLGFYVLSFLMLGAYWVQVKLHHNYLSAINRGYTWLSIGFLMGIAVIPYSTKVLTAFPHQVLSLQMYAANLAMTDALLLASWAYAARADLIHHKEQRRVFQALCRPTWIALSGYALASVAAYWHLAPALVCLLLPPLLQMRQSWVDRNLGPV